MTDEIHNGQSDHDLLIRIDTKLELLFKDFGTVKADIIKLESCKAEKRDLTDHEKRLRRLERYGAIAIGALTIIQIIVSKL